MVVPHGGDSFAYGRGDTVPAARAAGHLRWAQRHTSLGNNFDSEQALLVNGGVYVAGHELSANSSDGTLLKYRP